MAVVVHFDAEADAVNLTFRRIEPGEAVRTRQLDERRLIDYDDAGEPIAVELLWVSDGIDLEGLPRAEEIRSALASFPNIPATV